MAGAPGMSAPFDPPFGTYAPTPEQSRILRWFHDTPLGLSRLRRGALNRFKAARAGPVDASLFGLKVRFYPHDNASDGKAAVCGRAFNAQELKWLDRALPRGGVFVDIGANMGFFSLFAATKGAKVVAVEPHPRLFARLSANMALNGVASARLFECAVGGEAGMARLEVAHDLGIGRIGEGGEDGVEVPVRTLTDILAEAGVTAVDALKIDIEGYEDRALVPFFESAPRALWPRSVVIEHSAHAHWRTDLLALLRACGYRTRARSRGNAWMERTP